MKRLICKLGRMCRSKLFLFILVCVLFVFWSGYMYSGLHFYRYFDIPTLLLMFLAQVFFLQVTGMGKAFCNGFKIAFLEKQGISRMELQMAVKAMVFSGKIAIITAVISAMMGGVSVLYTMQTLSMLGPMLAAMLLSILYAAVILLILTPVQMKLESKVISYMDEPKEDEPEEVTAQTLFFKMRAMGLTDREAEVARLVSAGLSNKEIGQILYISDATVKKHVTHILEKTGCVDREELTEKVKAL